MYYCFKDFVLSGLEPDAVSCGRVPSHLRTIGKYWPDADFVNVEGAGAY